MADSPKSIKGPGSAPRSKTASPVPGASPIPGTSPVPGASPVPGVSSVPGTSPEAAPAPAPDTLDVDETETQSDNTSLMDSRISSYTASLTSSAIDYPTEYGRRYHAFRAGSYFAPNDESEKDRLDFNHMLMVKTIGRKLFLAPVPQDKTHRILDIGTGTGIWALEVSDLFPNAEVIGNDLSAIQPEWVTPNVKFEIDDVESEWLHDEKFDFIFARYMAGSLSDWPTLMSRIYENTTPGGWVEFQDYDLLYTSDDNSINMDHHTLKWDTQFIDACKSIGREACPGPKLEGWVKDAGFINVKHQTFKMPIGPWPSDPHYKDIGMTNLMQVLDGLEAFTLRIFCGVLGWTREEVEVLLLHVRKELKSGAFHAYTNFHVVYAQKPEVEADE